MDRVLLVEDDRLTSMELHHSLRDAGFDVETAYSGLGAVAAIERQPPRYLVTSLDLGPGPDGLDVAYHARSLRSDVQIVFVSSGPSAHAGAGSSRGSTSQFIGRPYRSEQVVNALRRPLAAA